MTKTLIFYDDQFPYEGTRPSKAWLDQLSETFEVVTADRLGEALADQDFSSYVHLHGPYFPKEAWPDLLAFFKKGHGLLHIGGAPFRCPVHLSGHGEWEVERAQTAYHRQLQIHEVLPVASAPVEKLQADHKLPVLEGKESLFSIKPTHNLILHVTRHRDRPEENGSSGPMDAHIHPLLKGISKDDREVAAPAVLVENTKGDFAGGRWLMINQTIGDRFWENGGGAVISEWADFTRNGVTEIWVKPNYATYEPGDRASITIQIEEMIQQSVEWQFAITITKDSQIVWTGTETITATDEVQFLRIPVDVVIQKGQYLIECLATSASRERRIYTQGFWGNDPELLQQGSVMEARRDYFWKDGRPFPIVGQTYMTSDVARKFVFMPNVAAWDYDMATMKEAGINLIRTGLWTGWRHLMYIDGHPSEEVLRSIDAFLLTAKKHNIEVTFNFFAFTPIAYEGENPYLDPRSVKAQKRFIRALIARHADTTNVQWDLINEPSMFDPERFFQGPRAVHDRFEQAAFEKWLKDRHGAITVLQERWDMTPEELPDFESVVLPEQDDINFDIEKMKQPKQGLRWLDYTLFTMAMHNKWASELTETIKSVNAKQLVTVGQDEAMYSQRPTPFFYQEAVDYTTVHSWWLMDQLVWDGIFTKTPYKPNLIQETGIMYVETADSKAKRSEEELRNILERKYAYAFSTGGAGAVQWLWNTNFYMDNTNESNIGALRADGTQKPEADVSYDFGKFISEIRDLFIDRELEDVAVVFPYSNDFSNRKFAFDATTSLTRVLAYQMNVPFRAMGEYHLEALEEQPPKLLIVPSAHNFSKEAAEKIFNYVRESGATLLWTGPMGLDAYWEHLQPLADLFGEYRLSNVVREELLAINGVKHPVSFGDRRIGEVNKEVVVEDDSRLIESELGQGKVLWCPLPVELNERTEVLEAVYRQAMEHAGVAAELKWLEGGDLPGIYGRKLTFRDGYLYTFVSEYASDTAVKIQDPVTRRVYQFILEKERSVLFATDKQGEMIATYREQEIYCGE
ncbi:beta-galactosidase [Gracilibacillus caseinilyticus]|uniref:Beta-galactosidase n=1 Tax=Gracilibacillus caseinilyticus TaxID=2932256 RepID=A0ABY4F0N5_9BACI|nr:beta-galactosidase [Gracilibacillus caseinilyticus]UOQ49652.1 beta-galactosidase [Gracilibacillus caseinilyticus]